MPVLCVESGITYATGVAAVAAEGGANRSMRVSGSVSFATSVNPSQYNLGIVIFANPGEETQDDGDINIGAQMTGSFACAAPNSEIRDLRTNNLNLTSAANMTLRRIITDGGGSDGVLFNDTIDALDGIVYNTNDGFISSATRANSSLVKLTVIGATRFGFANGKVNDSVDVNSANQGYFGEMPGSGNLWEHDGSGTDTITESPVTDIFVDFAAGKYGILASSSPGAAGAGAFIGATPSGNTLVADSGAYSYAGSDVVLLSSRVLKADSGSYNYTGTDASLIKGYLLTANNGSYSYSGQDVNLIHTPAGSFVLVADSGNYSYTGADINFNRNRVIIASSGVYSYSGTDIQIILPGQIWTDKPSVSTDWSNQDKVMTIWTDK